MITTEILFTLLVLAIVLIIVAVFMINDLKNSQATLVENDNTTQSLINGLYSKVYELENIKGIDQLTALINNFAVLHSRQTDDQTIVIKKIWYMLEEERNRPK